MRSMVRMARAAALATALVAPPVWAAQAQSLKDLAARHDSATCQACHDRTHQEWAGSYHARSVTATLGSLRAFVDALEKERRVPPDKTQMLKCLDCHAPMVNDASEGVVREIVGLVKTAVDDKDDTKKKAAREALAPLSVNCTGCHVVKGPTDPLVRAAAETMYGPTGARAPHPTAETPAMRSSVFCSQCHALWYAKDGEYLYCTTIFESHQNAYRGTGGTQTCQDCHMEARGHTFPGAHDQDLVKEGLGLELQAAGIRQVVAGKLQPRGIVTVDVANRAGHRIPDG